MDRGSTTFGNGRLGTRLTAWDTTNNTDSSYVTKTGKYRDHVCRPVIVDPDGTMRPAIEFMHHQKQDTTDPLVEKIEKLIEHMEPPPATLSMDSSATKKSWGKPSDEFVEKVKYEVVSNAQTVNSGRSRMGYPSGMFQHHTTNSEYSGNNNKWSRQSDTTDDASKSGWGKPSSRTTDFSTNGWGKPVGRTYETSTNGLSQPGSGTYNTSYAGWSKPSGGTYDTGYNGWGRSGGSAYDTGDNEWSKPLGGTYDTGAYGWSKPTSTTLHHPDYDDSYGKHGSTQKSGWSRPHHVSWATPTSYEIPPSKTSYVDNRNDYVREPTRLLTPTTTTRLGLFSTATPTYPRKETVVDTIDSTEASRRYGSSSAKPPAIQENSTTIDSREAARKYRGSFV
ncbi:hypothetical protein ACLOJK_018012 [Asimina triloba]